MYFMLENLKNKVNSMKIEERERIEKEKLEQEKARLLGTK